MLTVDPLVFHGREWLVISYAPARPAVLEVLTGSELEVVDRWTQGLSMRAIAEERGVAARTIARQIASAYEKLRVSSRAELITKLRSLDEG